MKEYLLGVGYAVATIVAVLCGMGMVEIGYLTAAASFGLTNGQAAAAILAIALVAGAVKAARERRRRRNRCEALDKTIQLWEAIMAKQAYEMPESEWNRLRPFYTVTVEVLKKERDRTEKRGEKAG